VATGTFELSSQEKMINIIFFLGRLSTRDVREIALS
jgi:hypothetical protein